MEIKLSHGVEIALSAIAEAFHNSNTNRTIENAIKQYFLILALSEDDQERIIAIIDQSRAAQELTK